MKHLRVEALARSYRFASTVLEPLYNRATVSGTSFVVKTALVVVITTCEHDQTDDNNW